MGSAESTTVEDPVQTGPTVPAPKHTPAVNKNVNRATLTLDTRKSRHSKKPSYQSKTLQHPINAREKQFKDGAIRDDESPKSSRTKKSPGSGKKHSRKPSYQSKTLQLNEVRSSKDIVTPLPSPTEMKKKKPKGGASYNEQRYSSKTMPSFAFQAQNLGELTRNRASSKHAISPRVSESLTSSTIASAAKSRRKADIESITKVMEHARKKSIVQERRQRAMSLQLRMNSPQRDSRTGSISFSPSNRVIDFKKQRATPGKTHNRYGGSNLSVRRSPSATKRERRVQEKVNELQAKLEVKETYIKGLEEQIQDLQEKVLDYQRRLGTLKKKHGKLKLKAKSKIERADMSVIAEYQQMENKLQQIQYQMYYGDSKKDRRIEELTEKVEQCSKKMSSHTDEQMKELKSKLHEMQTKAVEDWMFGGEMEITS